jgi:hypothetical protein
VNVKEAGRKESEVANCSDCVSGNFEALAGLAGSGPIAVVFLNGWPHEALGEEISRCFNTRLAEGVQGVENLTAENRRDTWTWFSRRGVAVQLD